MPDLTPKQGLTPKEKSCLYTPVHVFGIKKSSGYWMRFQVSLDMTYLAVGRDDGSVIIWDLDCVDHEMELPKRTQEIAHDQVFQQKVSVKKASRRKRRKSTVAKPKKAKKVEKPVNNVVELTFSTCGRFLVYLCVDGTICCFEKQ